MRTHKHRLIPTDPAVLESNENKQELAEISELVMVTILQCDQSVKSHCPNEERKSATLLFCGSALLPETADTVNWEMWLFDDIVYKLKLYQEKEK